METINIKKNNNSTDVAVSLALIEIDTRKKFGEKVFKVIHGYGSHGVGGDIKKELHKVLRDYKLHKKIRNYIPGEQLTFLKLKENQKEISKEEYDTLFVDEDLNRMNPGCTIIIV